MKPTILKSTLSAGLALSCLLFQDCSQPASAATVYTDRDAFLAAIAEANYFFNNFANLPAYQSILVPVQYSSNNVAYTLSCPPDGLWAMGEDKAGSPREVSTVSPNNPIMIAVTSGDGWAFGGDMYLTADSGYIVPGLVTVRLSDGTVTNVICPDEFGLPPFIGFIADKSAITSIQIGGQGDGSFPTMGSFYAARNPVAYAPSLTVPYKSTPAWLGGVGLFDAEVTGRPPFSDQLYKDGVMIAIGANPPMVVANVQQADYASSYSIKVTNLFGYAVASNLSIYPTTVAAWGWNNYGQRQTPPGMTNVWQVGGGLWHSIGLKAPGIVTAWGRGDYGQTNVPPGMSNVTAIAAGWVHNVALRSDGTVVAWGDNGVGQTNVPAGLNDAIAVAAGNYHCLALRSNGTVVGWGSKMYNQDAPPPGLSNVVAIACGGEHSLALKANGTVVAWGYNSEGQTNVPVTLSNVVAIAGGCNHSLALQDNGIAVGWGRNWDGQATVPPGISNVVAIAAGAYHSMVLRSDGSPYVWGINWAGQSTLPSGLTTNTIAVASGYACSMAIVGSGPLLRQATAQITTRTPSGFSLQIQTRSGCVYQLQYKDSLSGNNWTSMPLVAGNGRVKTFTDPSIGGETRFYRIRSW